MKDQNHYKILGVDKSASDAEIKKSYRRLAMRYHPDRNKGNEQEAEKEFKNVKEAYETLSDPAKRAAYDQGGVQFTFNTGGFNNGGAVNPALAELAKRVRAIQKSYDEYQIKKGELPSQIYDAKKEFKENNPSRKSYFNRRAMAPERKKAEKYLKSLNGFMSNIELGVKIAGVDLMTSMGQSGFKLNYNIVNQVILDIENDLKTRIGVIDNCLDVISGRADKVMYKYKNTPR